jgi:hypothetical protein
MIIQPELHPSAAAALTNPVAAMFLGKPEELRIESSEFGGLLPPDSSVRAQTQSESSLGENLPVFHERLTKARPTRWYGIND